MDDLNDPVIKELVTARVKLLLEKPFFGNLALRLTLVDASSWLSTAATDGRHFYYNRDFIKTLDRGQILFLVGHEVLHCVYDHFGRRGSRDPKILNMAQDYIINYTLVTEKVGVMPSNGLYDAAYNDEMTSEQVYDLLLKNSVTIKMPLDEHLQLGNDKGDDKKDGQGEVSVTVLGGKDGPPTLSEADLEKLRNEMKAHIIQAAQAAGAGNVPAGVARMISSLIAPKMDWRALLDAHIRSAIKDDYTFQKISRRCWGDGTSLPTMLLPSQDYMDTIDIHCAIDASGSLTDEMLRDILSEIRGIMTTYRDFRLNILSFDTQIYNVRDFTGENSHEIEEYSPGGGGGTLFECVFEHYKREGVEPKRLVFFTDGMPNQGWGDPDFCDVLWVIYGNPNCFAPWGITAHYEEK